MSKENEENDRGGVGEGEGKRFQGKQFFNGRMPLLLFLSEIEAMIEFEKKNFNCQSNNEYRFGHSMRQPALTLQKSSSL